MKKRIVLYWLFLLLFIILLLGFVIIKNVVNISTTKTAQVVFVYGNISTHEKITDEELLFLKKMFSGKIMYVDNPSCGFSEQISIVFDESQTFCIACDTCPVIYWKEKDRYFRLATKEKDELYRFLEKYNCSFPCV